MSPAAARVREDLLLLQTRIDMWEEDVQGNLRPINFDSAKETLRRALRNLNLVDAEQREHA